MKKHARSNCLCLSLALLYMMIGTLTQADAALFTDTQTFAFDGTTTPRNITLKMFDESLGTLTDIEIYTNINLTAKLQLINYTNQSQVFSNAQTISSFKLTGPAALVTAEASTGLINGTALPSQLQLTTFSGPTITQSQNTSIQNSLFDLYMGTGVLNFAAALGPFTSSASFKPGALGVGGNGEVNGIVNIAYSYDPTPIPSSVWLLGSGMLGMIGLGRKMM